jgi:hypothetical protein
VARRTGTRARGRLVSEASPRMWRQRNLLLCVLLARALPWLRKKLPFEASKVGPSVECRPRAESSYSLLDRKRKSRMGRGLVLQIQPNPHDDERGEEPSKAYRQNLQQCDDAIYVNLGTLCDSPQNGVGQPAANIAQGAEPS